MIVKLSALALLLVAAAAFAYTSGARSRAERSGVLWAAPEFSLVDQGGAPTSKASLRGRVWIANFIFTRCTSVCPTLTARMRALQRKLTNPELRFVSFSVDPEHDTPEALRRYAASWGKHEPRWALLHTEAESLQRLTDGMRVAVFPSGNAANPIVHTSLAFLVDAAGNVRGLYDTDDDDAQQKLIADALALSGSAPSRDSSAGRAQFDALGCAGCHDDAKIAPPLAQLSQTDDAYLRKSLLEPHAQLVPGYLDLMPSYAKDLSDDQLTALVGYVRSLSTSAPVPPAARVERDPVCGMSVRVTPETPHAERDGHTHYFCSESCRASFTR